MQFLLYYYGLGVVYLAILVAIGAITIEGGTPIGNTLYLAWLATKWPWIWLRACYLWYTNSKEDLL